MGSQPPRPGADPPAARPTAAAPDDFAELYGSQFSRVAVQLYAYLGDHAEAQDVTQEAFYRALKRWPQVREYTDPAAWVRKVAWNLATSRLRRVAVAVRYLARQRVETVPGPEPDRVALVAALARLSPVLRRTVVLHHLCHLTVAEIAEQEGVAEGTVRARLSRGRAALATYFTEPAPTGPTPTNPAPTNPAPTNPAPTNPAPTNPAPTNQAPTKSDPTNQAPTKSDPTEPAQRSEVWRG